MICHEIFPPKPTHHELTGFPSTVFADEEADVAAWHEFLAKGAGASALSIVINGVEPAQVNREISQLGEAFAAWVAMDMILGLLTR
jgi:hypothetical protein